MLGCRVGIISSQKNINLPNYLYNWDASISSTMKNSSGNDATNGQVVTTWQEKTGSSATTNFIAPSVNYGPLLDTTNKCLDFSNFRQLYINKSNNSTQMYNKTFFLVVTTSSSGTPEMVFLSKGKWDSGFNLMIFSNVEIWIKSASYKGYGLTTNTKMLLTIVIPNTSGSSVKIFKNGTNILTTNLVTVSSFTDVKDLILGSDGDGTSVITPNDTSEYTFKGKIHEILIYDGPLDDETISTVNNNLKTKWSIT